MVARNVNQDEPPWFKVGNVNGNGAAEHKAVIGERLRSFRDRERFSQRALGAKLGVSHATISKWETGDASIAAELLTPIAEALRCHPCDFFEARPAVPVPAAFERAFVPGGIRSYTTEQLMIRETLKVHMQLDDEEADELIRLAGMFQRRRKQEP